MTLPNPNRPEEAIAYFRSKVTLPKDEWELLDERLKGQAFTVAGTAQLDVIHDVWRALDDAISNGTDFKAFVGAIGDRLTAAWQGTVDQPAWRMQTIFRTNVQTAYAAGRMAQAMDPDLLEDRPYWMFDATLDGRTSLICKRLHGVVRPADDEWWKGRIPPCHHNCRSTVITLTEEEAKAQGGVSRKQAIVSQSGFGDPRSQWKPDADKYPQELWNVAKTGT